MVPPLVTGTFGGSDFIHSLLGEAGDHLSEASISDLNKAVNKARSDPANSDNGLVGLLRQIPGQDGDQASRDISDIRAGAGGDPNSMSPQQVRYRAGSPLSSLARLRLFLAFAPASSTRRSGRFSSSATRS